MGLNQHWDKHSLYLWRCPYIQHEKEEKKKEREQNETTSREMLRQSPSMAPRVLLRDCLCALFKIGFPLARSLGTPRHSKARSHTLGQRERERKRERESALMMLSHLSPPPNYSRLLIEELAECTLSPCFTQECLPRPFLPSSITLNLVPLDSRSDLWCHCLMENM